MTPSIYASTPEPPYYAVIFTSLGTPDSGGYEEMSKAMQTLAAQQPGYLGFESTGDEFGISVSYWRDLAAIAAWKKNLEHAEAQRNGKTRWYDSYRVRVAKVEREYGWEKR